MKGDIKRRREVERLSASLPDLKERQRAEAQRCCGSAWIGKEVAWCDCCNGEFGHTLWKSKRKKVCCPHCGALLDVKRSPGKNVSNLSYYYEAVYAVEGWQVVRTYCVRREARRRERFCGEVLQPAELKMEISAVFDRFLKEGCEPIVIGLGVYGASWYCDLWNMESSWKIRRESSQYRVGGWVESRPQILPELRRRGLKGIHQRGATTWRQLDAVLNDPKAEILLKAGARRLYEYYTLRPGTIRTYWQSVRVALRHGYKINDVSMWLDLVELLELNGRDVRNPLLICPADLRRAHDVQREKRRRIVEKARKEEEERKRRELAEMLGEGSKENMEYVARLGEMLGIEVRVGRVVLKPLQSISDFYDEGEKLHHCVFENGYYKKAGCVIIGARVDGKRTETIEVSTDDWRIMQCRGKHNQPSKWHDKIVRAMESNMNKFRTAYAG